MFSLLIISLSQFRANSVIDSLETVLSNTEDRNQVPVLIELADEYLPISKEQSFEYAARALELCEKYKITSEKPAVLYFYATYYKHQNEYDKALEYLKTAVKLVREIGDKSSISKILNGFGSIYYAQTDYQNALKYYLESIDEGKGVNEEILTLPLMNTGQIYYYWGEFEKSLEYYQRALENSEKFSSREGIAHALIGIGKIYRKWEKYEDAKDNFSKAIKIYREIENRMGEAVVLNWIGMLYKDEGNFQKAIEYQERSLEIKEEINNRKGVAASLNGLGISYKKLGDYEKALQYYKRAVAIQIEIEDKIGTAATLSNIGLVYSEMKKYEEALKYIFDSNRIARDVDYKQLVINNYGSVSDIYTASGNCPKALYFMGKHLSLKDSVFSEEKHKQFAEMRTKYETEKKEQENVILKQKNEFIELAISRQKSLRNFLIIISLVILISMILVYNQYRLKQKAFKELEKADQIIREQKNELEIMNKTRDRFFSIISHDLKNSFTSLQMGTKLLSNIEELDKDEIKLVSKELAESVENLYKLLENLLEWARIQIGRIHHEPEELDISEVLEDVLKVMDSKAAQKNIRLTTEIIENTKVFADKNMLYSVLQNLISNAIKFTEQTGEIRIQQTEKENKLEMSICDNGVGMSAIQLSKIFRIDEIISTPGTDDEKGTGLGLILCKEFIDKNGGEIRVESELGKGTEVCFNLPLK